MRPLIMLSCLLISFVGGGAPSAIAQQVKLTPLISLANQSPAFRLSMQSQIQLLSTLSLQPVPSMLPLISPAQNPADPFHAETARLVAVLAAQPQIVAEHQAELSAAFGKESGGALRDAAQRLQTTATRQKTLESQLRSLSEEVNLRDTAEVSNLASRLNHLFEGSNNKSGALPVIVKDSPFIRRPHSVLAKSPANASPGAIQRLVAVPGGFVWVTEADRPQDRAYANRFAGIPGVDHIQIRPVTLPTWGEHRTYRTDIVINFTSAEALAAAQKSGKLPMFGNLRGWITGYHVIPRVEPELAKRERDLADQAYAARFSGIPGVSSVRARPVTAPVMGSPRTYRTDILINFTSAEALAAAQKSGKLPLFGNLRGWITGYHVIPGVEPVF